MTDITVLSSVLLVSADEEFLPCIGFPQVSESVYEMRGVVSRKKQLMPILSELLEKYRAEQG